MDYLLNVKDLNKSYKDSEFTLSDLNLTIRPGEVVGLVGKNGSGKSTLINTLVGNRFPSSGDIEFFDQKATSQNDQYKEYLGVVFDDLRVPHKLDIKHIDKAFSHIYQTWDSDKFNKLIQQFELPNNRQVKDFSRGMKMKVAISMTLAHDSRLLILDEATAGMDVSGREEVLDILDDYIGEENGIMISSHISEDIEAIATKLVFMRDGRIILTEEKEKLLQQYGIVRQPVEEFNVPNQVLVASREYRGERISLVDDYTQVEGAESLNSIDDATKILMRGEI
ncbi:MULTISPECIES: ABC transporter ATP-binding protein [Staphylococcus]|uniref:ABC transporter ATP-binding protein n=1 Tax=Staphylococcus pettenkoferi TaxID=170573 RepID=A0A2N6QHL1_9STAP|nr:MULTISPECIES: ABC transporter ATP-binding protein [Staphylococcus]MBX8993112.1 ABC transporter ATP-binding protein [Staphylococcus pettenkoferi]MCI2791563.1 ABC transporter ATP-binding protein [Staphylococcus pettenkoferi]MCY1604422.1 ABC transporter ATP-binding protein [Staphylococcus pettenkoferi]OFK76625.1 multidrug ABC transporter ATP-binding protein [Staphylococcus sp. HMSC071G07]PMC19064.1 ABC transporter ATP-binding protein [Staphylococcus pettenkoferi]